jgi:hypothetical protein
MENREVFKIGEVTKEKLRRRIWLIYIRMRGIEEAKTVQM